jgi:hypothetical protein
VSEADLRILLQTLDPLTRDDLRRVLIRDQADRDAIASQLLRYRDERGDNWADIIDMLTMHPDTRRRVVRLLGQIDAGLAMAGGVGYDVPRLNGSPRRTTSARTTASLCSVARAEKTSVSVPSRACRRSSVRRGRCQRSSSA